MNVPKKRYEAIHAFIDQRIVVEDDFPIIEDFLDGIVVITDRYGYHLILHIDRKTMNIYDADGVLKGINLSGKNLKDASFEDYVWEAPR